MIEEIAASERIARFILSKSHFSREKKRVKASAFVPKEGQGLSVSRISLLNLDSVIQIGRFIADARPGNTLYGWGEFLASSSQAAPLTIRPDEPPERHALIEGWASDKEKQMELAQRLAENSTLCLIREPYRGAPPAVTT